MTVASFAREAIIFATPPTQSTELTIKRYAPLAKYLSKKIGRPVKLVPADNFIEYSQNLLDNKYDLIFDGPQFIGWRIGKYNHQALAKLPKKLSYAIVVRADNKLPHYRKLAGRRVCGIGSPNLMTLGMLDLYPNPASVPTIVPVENFKVALSCLRKGEGSAAVVPWPFWNKRPPAKKRGLKLFYRSVITWPHRGFSIGDRVDKRTQELLRKALLDDQAVVAGAPILKRYKSKAFVGANNEEYQNLGKLLKPIWGFHE